MGDGGLAPVEEPSPAIQHEDAGLVELLVDHRRRRSACERLGEGLELGRECQEPLDVHGGKPCDALDQLGIGGRHRGGTPVRGSERNQLLDDVGELDLQLRVNAGAARPTTVPGLRSSGPRAAGARHLESGARSPSAATTSGVKSGHRLETASVTAGSNARAGAGSLSQTSPDAVVIRATAAQGRVRTSSSSPKGSNPRRRNSIPTHDSTSSNQWGSSQGSGCGSSKVPHPIHPLRRRPCSLARLSITLDNESIMMDAMDDRARKTSTSASPSACASCAPRTASRSTRWPARAA